MKFSKYIAIILLALTLLQTPLAVHAAVPTFDVGLNPKMDLLLQMIAGIYQKDVGKPPTPPPGATFGLPTLGGLFSSIFDIAQCPIAGAGGIIGAIIGLITGSVSLDCVTWIIGKTVLHEFSQDVTEWIQSENASQRFFNFAAGEFFEENPLAVTDWEDFLLAAADNASGYFINELGITEICEPFAPILKAGVTTSIFGSALGKGAPLRERARCTLSEALGNLETFYDNFSEGGGWARWIELTEVPNNNPYRLELTLIEERDRAQGRSIQKNELEANASEGFLGVQRCVPVFAGDEDAFDTPLGASEPIGEDCQIITPGQSVEEILRDNIGGEVEQLNLADEMDELLFSLFQSLIDDLLFSSQGILGTNVRSFNVTNASPGGGTGSTAPPPPPDSDNDGVQDSLDACPNTTSGVAVDSLGCEIPPPPLPAPPPPPPPPSL